MCRVVFPRFAFADVLFTHPMTIRREPVKRSVETRVPEDFRDSKVIDDR